MKKNILFLLVFMFAWQIGKPHSLDISSDGSIIVVLERNADHLNVFNCKTNEKSTIRIVPGCSDWLRIVRDTMVILHYEFGKDETVIYGVNSGKKLAGLPEFCFADITESYLYWIDYSNTVNRYDIFTFKPMKELAYLEKVKGYLKEDMFEMSDNNKRIAIVMNAENKKKGMVAIFDLTTGKLVSKLKGFNSFDEESEVTYNKKDILFLDLNIEGTKIIVGNNKVVELYDCNTGKVISRFEEDQKFQRENFSEAYYSLDFKVIYIASALRIYKMNPDNLTPIENIASGILNNDSKMDKQIGRKMKTEEFFDEFFAWHNLAESSDRRYLFSLCMPYTGKQQNETFYVWRKDLIKDGEITLFYYK